MVVQTNNDVIPAQMSPGLARSAPCAVSLGFVGEKWATEAEHRWHWNMVVNKEVMTCCIMRNPSKRGYSKQMYDMWCARNLTIVVADQTVSTN